MKNKLKFESIRINIFFYLYYLLIKNYQKPFNINNQN
jgi:hypothetical protein